jgi:hypothetical protein
VTQTEEVVTIAEHAKEDLDHEWDQGDGGENADACHIQPVGEHIQGVQGSKIAQNNTLREVQQPKQAKAQHFRLRIHGDSPIEGLDRLIIEIGETGK